MQLNRRTDLALRTLTYLALREAGSPPVPVAAIAEAFDVSAHHLDKVARDLVRLGFARAHRGRRGGLTLARPAEDIDVGAVVEALEPMALVECHTPATNTCVIAPRCALAGLLDRAREGFLAELRGTSLADLTRRRRRPLRALVGLQGRGVR